MRSDSVGRSRYRLFWPLVAVSGALLLGGCQSRLPGPLECEDTAIRLLGRTALEVKRSAAAQRWVAQMAHACLTTPFDREALRCLEETKSVSRCLEQMVRRDPKRQAAVRALLSEQVTWTR